MVRRTREGGPSGRPRIFCVGLNKCGTTSLHELFRASGIPSVSAGHARMRPVAQTMFSNLSAHRPLLTGIERFTAFSDLNFLSRRVYLDAHVLFARLDAEYPGSRFVLNTRPKDGWLASRRKHVSPAGMTFVERFAAAFDCGEDEVVAIWSDQWDRHHAAVRAHFAGQDERFLEFDITSDDPAKLAAFLRPHEVDPRAWGQHNPSTARAYAVRRRTAASSA